MLTSRQLPSLLRCRAVKLQLLFLPPKVAELSLHGRMRRAIEGCTICCTVWHGSVEVLNRAVAIGHRRVSMLGFGDAELLQDLQVALHQVTYAPAACAIQ